MANKCMLTSEEEFVASIASNIFTSMIQNNDKTQVSQCVEVAVNIVEETRKQMRMPLKEEIGDDKD